MTDSFAGFMYGPYAALLCEAFEARIRYTGIALGLTIGGVLGSAFSPMLFAEVYRLTDTWMPIAACVMVSAIMSAGAVAALQTAKSRASAASDSMDNWDEQSPRPVEPETTPHS